MRRSRTVAPVCPAPAPTSPVLVLILALALLTGCGLGNPPAPVSVPPLQQGAEAPPEPAAPAAPAQPAEPARPSPALVAVNWAAGEARGSLEPGRPLQITAPDTLVQLEFSAPVAPESLRAEGSHPALKVTPDPGGTAGGATVALRVTATRSTAGEIRITALTDPAGRPLDGLPLVIPVLAPNTPPLTAAEQTELQQLGLKLWAMAAAGDLAGLKAQIAPEEELSSPGGEFLAEEGGRITPGMEAVVQWAVARKSATPKVQVQGRKGYAMYDVIIVDTGSGHFVAFVTITERKIAKLFGLEDYYNW